MLDRLFVYGSLKRQADHPMGARLRREARLVGEGTIQGRLYRVSWYPAAVDADDPSSQVHGEVYALSAPAATLPWLDRYEGMGAQSGRQTEYERAVRPVRLKSGEVVEAWVYLYRLSVRALSAIPDGRWDRD